MLVLMGGCDERFECIAQGGHNDRRILVQEHGCEGWCASPAVTLSGACLMLFRVLSVVSVYCMLLYVTVVSCCESVVRLKCCTATGCRR